VSLTLSFALTIVLVILGAALNPTAFSHLASSATATSAPPTATPRPTATLSPTPKPTATPLPLTVAITCASAVDYHYGKVCAHTHPGAKLYITVTYCSGNPATSPSLQGVFIANSHGDYTWHWTPQTTCRGQAHAAVSAAWDGLYVIAYQTFNVA
jgi:hypothetical protein